MGLREAVRKSESFAGRLEEKLQQRYQSHTLVAMLAMFRSIEPNPTVEPLTLSSSDCCSLVPTSVHALVSACATSPGFAESISWICTDTLHVSNEMCGEGGSQRQTERISGSLIAERADNG